MRLFLMLIATCLSLTAHAKKGGAGVFICTGAGQVEVDIRRELMSIDGRSFQMTKERLGKSGVRLAGHDMIFVRSPGSNILIVNGVSHKLNCRPAGDQQLQFAAPKAFQRNTVVHSQSTQEDDDDGFASNDNGGSGNDSSSGRGGGGRGNGGGGGRGGGGNGNGNGGGGNGNGNGGGGGGGGNGGGGGGRNR